MIITEDKLPNFKPTGVLHLGAHIGEEAPFYERIGAKRVLWFECNPDILPTLRTNLKQYPNQHIVEKAASNVDYDTVSFNITNNEGASSSLLDLKDHSIVYPHITVSKKVKVTTITVDTAIREEGLQPSNFDFANLDIQGGEMLALQGMVEVLPHLKLIYIEVNFREMYEGCPLIEDINKFLLKYGFTENYIADTNCGWGDAIYLKR